MPSRAAVLTCLCLAGVLAGCGAQARSQAPPPGRVQRAFAGSPPALAALHARADRLLGGGWSAFHAELATLQRAGLPVVVNKWASWCVPCQSEFPIFQTAAVADGRRVAFIGLDGKDASASAAAFLRRFPVTYPSYEDPQEDIARRVEAATYYPTTVFIDRRGRIRYVHAGSYTSAATLRRDIELYVQG